MPVGHSDRGDSSSQMCLGLCQDNKSCDVVSQEVRHKDSSSFLYTSSSHRTNCGGIWTPLVPAESNTPNNPLPLGHTLEGPNTF